MCHLDSRPIRNPRRTPKRAVLSVEEDHIRRQDPLILFGAVIVGRGIIGVLVSQFRAEQTGILAPYIEPVAPADAVIAVLRLRPRALAASVIEILVARYEKIRLRYLEILVIYDRPGRSKAADLAERANSSIGIRLDRKRPENARHIPLVRVIRLG